MGGAPSGGGSYGRGGGGSLLKLPNIQQSHYRVWDEADYVVPPAENGAFFITTNILITHNQTQVTKTTF